MRVNIKNIFLFVFFSFLFTLFIYSQNIPKEFITSPGKFSVVPFWFCNDSLNDQKIVRQFAEFESHGAYGFVIHPRIGLPEETGWLSPRMIHSMRVAISEASKRNMYVIHYDEDKYVSGYSG